MNKTKLTISYACPYAEYIQITVSEDNKPMFHHSDIHIEDTYEVYTPESLSKYVLSEEEKEVLINFYEFLTK